MVYIKTDTKLIPFSENDFIYFEDGKQHSIIYLCSKNEDTEFELVQCHKNDVKKYFDFIQERIELVKSEFNNIIDLTKMGVL